MFWRPWEDKGDSSQEDFGDSVVTKKRHKLCKNCQQIIINVHKYCVSTMDSETKRSPIIATVSKMVDVNRNSVAKIIKSGPVSPKKRGNKTRKFAKMNNFQCDLIRRTIYAFYANKKLPTVDMILQDLKMNTDFPYQRSTLHELLHELGFNYKKIHQHSVLLESARYRVWRYEYITKLRKARRERRNIVYLDETWYDSHDIVKESSTDCSCQCISDLPSSRENRIIILHAGSKDGWVENGLLLSAKQNKGASADMNPALFEKWFKEQLLPNLIPNSVIVLDNASYHSRLSFKIPDAYSGKQEILDFMMQFNIPIPEPVPIIPVLLGIVKKAGIEKKYVIDEMAARNGFEVVRLPPYHCIFNPIEQVWPKVKHDIRGNNCNPTNSNACQLIKQAMTNVTPDLWKRYVEHAIKEENRYFGIDEDVDLHRDSFIINTGSDSEDSD